MTRFTTFLPLLNKDKNSHVAFRAPALLQARAAPPTTLGGPKTSMLVSAVTLRLRRAKLSAIWGHSCPYISGGGWAGTPGHLRCPGVGGPAGTPVGLLASRPPPFHGTLCLFSGPQNSKIEFSPKTFVFGPTGPRLVSDGPKMGILVPGEGRSPPTPRFHGTGRGFSGPLCSSVPGGPLRGLRRARG